ncbi:hypothetical protein [Cuspidothrix issatschenkoi]|uniref:Type II secretion system protein GspC N-terminal domain-containing protein n=1 Tax=Cuspidothrix issatschenkoi CHARLIE-1 TaxID=2052836 RepID=A0A2S6CZ87_9CYAN|nr:hypothetical protein [Cuspidothrix issatschenkoi]PPJ65027.1 hypothetical protein CUN59_01525 [Cuspidothrix issatschenkoi CHARLIE-1]
MLPKSSSNLPASKVTDRTGATLIIDFVPNEPWTIESYAEDLMDELFNDLDSILDGRHKRNYPRDRQEYISGQTMSFKMPDVVLPSAVHIPLQSPPAVKNVQTATLVVSSPSVRAITDKTKPEKSSVTTLMLMGLGLTGTALGIVYVMESGLLTTVTTQLTNHGFSAIQTSSPVAVKPDGQLDLVNYMLEALTVIEQQGTNNNKTTALPLPNTQATPTLPLPLAVNNISPAPSRLTPPNVVERIYIPVYQSEPPRSKLPPVPPVPIPPSAHSGVTNTPVNPLPSVPQPKINTTEVNPQGIKLAPPKLPTIAPLVPVKEPVNVPQQVYTPTYSAQLEGLLELGKKSVALFEMDGVTRRINLGENIGSTGWILVDVTNGEAIIRRNGEVRSIYTGQKI